MTDEKIREVARKIERNATAHRAREQRAEKERLMEDERSELSAQIADLTDRIANLDDMIAAEQRAAEGAGREPNHASIARWTDKRDRMAASRLEKMARLKADD